MSDIVWLRIPKKTLEADRRIDQSEASLTGQVHQTDQSVAFTNKRFVWQDNKADASSYRQVASAQPIKRLRSILWTNHKTEVSAWPITFFGRIILQTESSAHPITSFGRIILWTEASAQPITSVGRIIFGRTFLGRIIFRTNRRLSQSHPLVGLSSDGLSSDISSFGRIFG